MKTKTILAALMVASFAFGAGASSITIDSVVQRWPWNNKVDITYTIEGGQDLKLKSYARIIFTATIDGTPYMIDGRSIGADASDGQHTATWIPPTSLRVKSLDCTMTAQLLSAEIPSGNDYMIIDLETGEVTYEGRYADSTGTVDLTPSTNRYNTAIYKSDKMVLKRIPKWADRATLPNSSILPSDGYPVGDNNWANNKPVHYWQTQHDYYIGVFECTKAQYDKLGLTNNTAGYSDGELTANGKVANTTFVPAVYTSYQDLRGTAIPTNSIVPASAGSFFERLNFRTKAASSLAGFDFPTEVMYEIAQRAGTTKSYSWDEAGYSPNGGLYCVSSADNFNTAKNEGRPLEVGSKLPNFWGLYDTAGNEWEYCRDDTSRTNLSEATDPFSPAYDRNNANCRLRGGNSHKGALSNNFASAYRSGGGKSGKWTHVGFRVAIVMD